MPPGVQRSTASVTFSQYVNRQRSLSGRGFSPNGDTVSRLQLFNLAGMDYQGQVSSGYGHQGMTVGLGGTMNVFDFIFPLIPLPGLSPDASLSLSGNGLKEYFVLIQRYPQALYKSHAAQNPQTRRYETAWRRVWATSSPLCLLELEGVSGEITLRAGVSARIEIPFPTLADELGINANANAGASGALKGKFIHLSGAYTGAFPGPADSNLANDYGLEQVIDYLFSRTDRTLLKQEIDSWITDLVTNWLQAKQPSPTPQAFGQQGRRERLRAFGTRQFARLNLPQISEDLQNILNDYVFSLVNLEIRLPVFSSLLASWQQPSGGELLRKLEQLQDSLLQRDPRELPREEQKAALRQIQTYISLLKKSYRRIDPSLVPGLVRADQTFFRLFSFAGEAQASAGISAGASVQTPAIPLADIAIQASGGVGALANARVDIQQITYRYQSRLDGRPFPLFFTQDTWITYRRTYASAEAFAQASLAPLGFEQRAARQLAYQSMSYLSTALYWRHTTPYVVPEQGSGLRIGMSVAARRLILYARAARQRLTQISDPICRALRITIEQFDQLMAGANLASLDENQPGFPPYLFLEAAFPFPDDLRIDLKANRAEPKSTGGKRMLEDPRPLATRLQSLRLRIRISDVEANEQPLFKLGFPIINSRINLDLSRVRGAGQEGMFDYYVHWFSNPTLNTAPQAALSAQEASVPAVVLLHQ